MLEIETKYHIIQFNTMELPKYACIGKCKTVWREDEVDTKTQTIVHNIMCPKCGGGLRQATEKDYKVTKKNNELLMYGNAIVNCQHYVKSGYEELAKNGWCK